MAYACKTSSAKSIVAVIPYLPYSKQCEYPSSYHYLSVASQVLIKNQGYFVLKNSLPLSMSEYLIIY